MAKERSINPAQQQRKADKQKAVAKNKKQLQTQRNEKLARRNPERLQKQIDELKDLAGRGVLRPKDKETLSQLERDLKGVRRARETLGDAAPKFPSHERPPPSRGGAKDEQRQSREQQHLGKRRRDQDAVHSSDSDATNAEVLSIPMPRDTPPPIPNNWRRQHFIHPQLGPNGQRIPHALPPKPTVQAAQTTYSRAPQIRDLKKEAVRFLPAAVAQQKARLRGTTGGRLLEPEEADRLERSGYGGKKKGSEIAGSTGAGRKADMDAMEREKDILEEEARRFEEEIGGLHAEGDDEVTRRVGVSVEEVEDEGD